MRPRERSWGCPIPSGRAALRMLEEEGFYFERYIDIFDGGPTVTARHRRHPHDPRIDERDGLRDRRGRQGQGARRGRPAEGLPLLLRSVRKLPKKGVCIDPEAAELLEVEVGDEVVMVAR